ncbi:hypothetical protein Q4567_21740 [Aliiglaciecola sp. 2_MG-2023]|uniref:hypothetical protein n=1 Tax=unclassified Aliiglaciecola TaxID=2593648 RepID=UPI0026E37C45|nr:MULTISPECIES: hypothetical protein [unclassified Aliiglaciecola]MDO6713364.1 hypothetical protein [Aliiglaciecola sp. 2_MG-2023]MDO6754480.1 hypothetical protein [Aliiglaciecola sp. 1_MG-2023]
MKILNLAIPLLLLSQLAFAEVDISLSNDSEKEEMKRSQVLRLIEQHDLSKWWFTDKIIIDESVRSPFSHPVLTLKASMPNNDPAGLSQLLHEQIHWFEDSKKKEVENTISALRKMYPSVPVGYPDGARSEFSTYLHLAVCLMELDALTEVLGKEKAETVIATNGKFFYKWIYKTVLEDQAKIRKVLENHDLYIQ